MSKLEEKGFEHCLISVLVFENIMIVQLCESDIVLGIVQNLPILYLIKYLNSFMNFL